MDSLQLRKPFIAKPNWICAEYGHFADPTKEEHLKRASKIFRKWPSELIKEAKKIGNPLG